MTKEERTKTLINNIKLNINEQNVYEFGLCVEQLKQILDYIGELQKQNQKYKEVIDKAIEYIRSEYTITDDDVYLALYSSDGTLDKLERILKEVE